MFGELFSPMHMLFVLIIALVIFGPKRLPEIGRGIGKGIREFKGTFEGIADDAGKAEVKAEAKASDTAGKPGDPS